MRRILSIVILMGGLLLAGPAVQTAMACPLCKEANETNSALPRAYMYSIIFMLSVPAVVLAGFGIGFYHLSKSANRSARDNSAATDDELGGIPPVVE